MGKMLFAIIKDIVTFFIEYAPKGCLLAGIVVFCCWLWMAFRENKGSSREVGVSEFVGNDISNRQERGALAGRLILIFLLVLYLYVVSGITILSRSEGATRELSFELFRTFHNTFMARKQIYENIVMFVPFSMLLFMLAEPFRKWWVSLATGAVSSLLIEVTQWVTMTGHFEVDDILTNTIGMLIGYVLCVVVRAVAKRRME